MSQKDFALTTGISEGSLSGVFNGRTRPTIQMVESIHERFPKVSVEWIMFGTGSMYIEEGQSAASSADESAANADGSEAGAQSSQSAGGASSTPSLFDAAEPIQRPSTQQNASGIQKTVVKYVDKPERKITEIRIFYDDQTWETFEPKK